MEEIIELLKNGKTILYPTDTIWGIGCDATNEEACQKLIDIKQRPKEKSFVLLMDSFQMVEKYTPEFHEVCYDLVDCSVKPLTIIYPEVKGIAPAVLAEDGSVAIRITNDPTCLQLIRKLRRPLVSTSANISGQPHPTCFDEIDSQLIEKVDGVLKLRQKEKMMHPSTIIKISLSGDVSIIRK